MSAPVRPGPRRGSRGRVLSPSRLNILELIEAQSAPVTMTGLVKASGLHENTVRGHLEALLHDGYVSRRPAPSTGRGRPAWLWQGRAEAAQSPYAALAGVLAKALHEHSPHPRSDALAAGREWGRELASELPGSEPGSGTSLIGARRDVIGLLDQVGFAPVANDRATTVRLTRCPLLEAATRYPDIVCQVHLGIIQGALETLQVDGSASRLLPFSSPGECLLHLRGTRPESTPDTPEPTA